MGHLIREYEKLFDYLEKHKVYSLHQKNLPIIKKQEVDINSQLENLILSSKKKEVIQKTKKLVKESEEVGKQRKKRHRRKMTIQNGFDVNRFEELMRTRLIDDYKRIQSYERPYISVSELVNCIRATYYSRLKYVVDVRKMFKFSYLYLIQEVGKTIHNVIQSIYGFSEVEKTIVSEKYKVKGRCDAIESNHMCEIKSMDSDKYKKQYDKTHYEQGLIYATILNNEYDYNIEYVTIIYVHRNLKSIIPYDIPVDLEVGKKLLERALILRDSIEKKSVPEPIAINGSQCDFCPYKSYCEKDPCTLVRPFDVQKLDSFML
jgi:hypothetical protein